MTFCSEYASLVFGTCYVGDFVYVLVAWSVAAVIGIVASSILNVIDV
jgi:hypothetical protein